MSAHPVTFARTDGPRGHVLEWALDREWTCPYHDADVNDYWNDDDEMAEQCLSCRAAGWRILYDEDGWATMTVRQMEPLAEMLWRQRSSITSTMSKLGDSTLLKELSYSSKFEGASVRIPIILYGDTPPALE